jgi:hypothetical protein
MKQIDLVELERLEKQAKTAEEYIISTDEDDMWKVDAMLTEWRDAISNTAPDMIQWMKEAHEAMNLLILTLEDPKHPNKWDNYKDLLARVKVKE